MQYSKSTINNNNNNNNNSSNNGSGHPYSVDSSNQFLLRTENLEPLISFTNQLSREIESNNEKLSSICHNLDSSFIDFPEDIANNNSVPPNDGKTTDRLISYLLEQKYNIKTPKNEDGPDEDGADLKSQIESMNQLLGSKIQKNKQLFEIIKDYENTIFAELLPALLSQNDTTHELQSKGQTKEEPNQTKDEPKDLEKSSLSLLSNSEFDDIEIILDKKLQYQNEVYKLYLDKISEMTEVHGKINGILDKFNTDAA
ncbi:hypothetical protein KGF54_000023 [Candida jiufengensis]|uniref:uncharacterized protein n=1 Tax=Candida jiufengensis TaxID=497108 RepID=UPI002224199A|nr:uncharacterized protein KGF54_000023 [Candida jiufengensis]KAI5957095.1 hypothetical protein KGF54_000023 [Candida jiufengensis]